MLKKLAGDTAIYGVSSVLGRLLNYLLVPYYTYVFSAGQYGVITEFYAYAAFLNVLYTYGLETAYFRFATKSKDGEQEAFNLATSSILLSSLLFSIVLYLTATPLVSFLDYPGKEHYIQWFAMILAIDAVVAIPFARLRLQGKSKYFAVARLINISLNIALNLLFLSVLPAILQGKYLSAWKPLASSLYSEGYTIEYVFLANLLANSALLLLLWKPLVDFRITLSWVRLKPMLIYAYPILFAGLAWVTNEMLSRWALRFWLPEGFYPGLTNEAALGVFGAVYKFSVFMTLAVQAFRYAAEPFFFVNAADRNSPELFARVSHGFVLFGCLIVLGVGLNLDILQYILRQEVFRQGMHIVPILLVANLFLGIYYNVSIWYKLTDKTYYSTWLAVGGAVLTIALNFILIPAAGYEGSSWVTLLVYFLMAAVCYGLGQRYYPVPYPVIKDLLYIAATVLLIYITNNFLVENIIVSLALRTGIFIAFAAWMYWRERSYLAGMNN